VGSRNVVTPGIIVQETNGIVRNQEPREPGWPRRSSTGPSRT